MTTLTLPSGFTPRALTSWNKYFIPQSDTNPYSVGDAVHSSGGTDPAGTIAVTLHPGTGPARGVIVSVDPGLPATGGLVNGQKLSVPANKLAGYYVWVDDDPSHVFAMVDDGLTPANSVGASVGKYANFTPGAGSAANGGSSAAIASSTLGSSSGCLQVISLQPGSAYGAAATWMVKFAAHELANSNGQGGGSGVSAFSALTDKATADIVGTNAGVAAVAASANSALKPPTNWAASAAGGTPALTSGTAVLGTSFKNTTAGLTTFTTPIDGIPAVLQDDLLICLTAGAYTYSPAKVQTAAQIAAGATAGVVAVDSAGVLYKPDGSVLTTGAAGPAATTFATIWDTTSSAGKDFGTYTIAAALALTSTNVGSVIGGYCMATIVADGSHVPTFDGATIANWVNTAGARNRVRLERTGDSKFWTVGANEGTAIVTPVAAAITSAPVINPITAGSPVTGTDGTVTGVPTPTISKSLKKNGTVVSSPFTWGSYTASTAGDIFIVTQAATNAAYGGGTATPVDSAPVTVTGSTGPTGAYLSRRISGNAVFA